jgi:predicted ATP-grasp superfamily ATP-dependent carboligase
MADSSISAPRAPIDANRPIVLCNADYYGTLAATRFYGAHGIPVIVADDKLLAVARWSRHAARRVACPPIEEPERFIEWLLRFGDAEPGNVLYPTSDETTYLFTLHQKELSKRFKMYEPSFESILRVLDKKQLYAAAHEAGLDVPQTWWPETDADVERVAREAPMPILVKPRTQILTSHSKGALVTEAAQLLPRYRRFMRTNVHAKAVTDHFPDASRPMLQSFLSEAAEQIYCLAAFIDESGKLFAARGCVKVFQRPRRLGIGLCFEHAELDPALCAGAEKLARLTGYHGLFQLEFIRHRGKHLLIDFNPRFYNQLVFDIARGFPLPLIVHAAARGDHASMRALVEAAQRPHEDDGLVYCNRFGFEMMLTTQRASGRISAEEAQRWRSWYEAHRGTAIDPIADASDRLPGIVDVANQLYGYVRHPGAFVRGIWLDSYS